MVKDGMAANCDYAEYYRRTTAIQFVIDAFNGKVDSLLSKVKNDNYGILEQKIRDAYQLVNPRKEFFKIDISVIKKLVEEKGLQANWTMVADAAEYRESVAIQEKIQNDPAERAKWEQFMAAVSVTPTEEDE